MTVIRDIRHGNFIVQMLQDIIDALTDQLVGNQAVPPLLFSDTTPNVFRRIQIVSYKKRQKVAGRHLELRTARFESLAKDFGRFTDGNEGMGIDLKDDFL